MDSNTIAFPDSKFPYWNNFYGIIVYTFIYIIAHTNTSLIKLITQILTLIKLLTQILLS